jgi:argininosuccinate lyase
MDFVISKMTPRSAERMRQIHVIGNVQLDVLANPVSALPAPGGDQIVERIEVRPAGAAGNVSLALAALGTPHRLFGAVGDDYAGQWVLQELEKLDLAGDVQVVPGTATGISIALEAQDRERAFLTAHGVLDLWGASQLPDDAATAHFVLCTGYFSLPGLRGRATKELLEKAHRRGATTLLDTGWDPEDWRGDGAQEVLDLLPLVDIFLPNEPEAMALTHEVDAASAARALCRRTGGWVVIKLGERGAIATYPGQEPVLVAAPSITPRDTTGAGDSLAAGLLTELAEGGDPIDAVRLGVAVASTVIARSSRSRYPTRSDLLLDPSA